MKNPLKNVVLVIRQPSKAAIVPGKKLWETIPLGKELPFIVTTFLAWVKVHEEMSVPVHYLYGDLVEADQVFGDKWLVDYSKVVAHVSYNGTVWVGSHEEWQFPTKALYHYDWPEGTDPAIPQPSKVRSTKRRLEKKAEAKFVKALDKALGLAYLAGIENRGDILTLPLKELLLSCSGSKVKAGTITADKVVGV